MRWLSVWIERACILPRGRLCMHAGKRFQSATSFSIHCKRQQTPNKQGDDGWKVCLQTPVSFVTLNPGLLVRSARCFPT